MPKAGGRQSALRKSQPHLITSLLTSTTADRGQVVGDETIVEKHFSGEKESGCSPRLVTGPGVGVCSEVCPALQAERSQVTLWNHQSGWEEKAHEGLLYLTGENNFGATSNSEQEDGVMDPDKERLGHRSLKAKRKVRCQAMEANVPNGDLPGIPGKHSGSSSEHLPSRESKPVLLQHSSSESFLTLLSSPPSLPPPHPKC